MTTPDENLVNAAVEVAKQVPAAATGPVEYGLMGFLVILAGLVVKYYASSNRGLEAAVAHTEANTKATSGLYAHFDAQLAASTSAITALAERVAVLETLLNETRLLYRASVASERRCQDAFGDLIQEHARMMEVVRNDPPHDKLLRELFVTDRRVTNIIRRMSRPIDLGDKPDELRPE